MSENELRNLPNPTPHLIGGEWRAGEGDTMSSHDPATGEVIWTGAAASTRDVDAAVRAARQAQPAWSAEPDRARYLQNFAQCLEVRRDAFAHAISEDTGKPLWESYTEVDAMKGKVKFSLDACRDRRAVVETTAAGAVSATRFKPHGVTAVLGPFNLPGHLPNAHAVPALLAGNTVVFKPSELTPLVGRILATCWEQSGLPPGVFNMVQGARETGRALVEHPDVDGVYFTGGVEGGRAIARACVEQPGKIVALELGGNNPLIVWEPCEIQAAVYATVQSAFITAGQRCTCARRLIVPQGDFGDVFLQRLTQVAANLVQGPFTQKPEPFMGPLISARAADLMMGAQRQLIQQGAQAWLEMKQSGSFVSAGILDVTAVPDREDREFFGPLLQVIRVPDFEMAIAEANRTRFGLSAGLLCHDRARWTQFYREARAGIVNWNRPITGASGAQPFGGIGDSGNHRPSGFYAADYCSYPVASTEAEALVLPEKLSPGIVW